MPEIDGNILTRKIGPLAGWQWGALAAALAGAYILWRRKQAAAAAAASGTDTGTTAADQTGVSAAGSPPVVIVEQPTQPASSSTTTTPAPVPKPVPKPAPAPRPAVPPTPVPNAINWHSFPQFIAGLGPQGGTLRKFASVENGRIVGGEVRNGAPVYALVQTKQYGPVWEQGFNPRSLPNGTPLATLPQFNNLIVRGKAA